MVKYAAPTLLALPVSLAASQGAGLFSSYVSLSIELIGFPQWAGTRDSRNEFSNNLIDNLVKAQGSPLVVRVGGNSATEDSDRAIFDSSLTTPTAASCKNADPGAWQCIGPRFFDSYGAFPQGTRYSHNFNLATWNSSGFHTLEATVPLACEALRGQLAFFEVGNEPDLYIGSRRAQDYSVSQYVSEWTNTTARFEAYLREACPDMAGDMAVKYMFPSVSSPGSRLRVPDMFSAAAAAGDTAAVERVTQVSVHNYMGGATQPGVTLQATLMNHTAVTASIGRHVAYAQAIAAHTPADYVIGEHNSLYGGGAAGLSDVFGAALWGMDFSLFAASTGVIKRLHFHQSVGSPYAAWSPVSPMQTKPPYYGKLAAGTFLAGADKLQVKTLPLGSGSDGDVDSGYGAYVNGDLRRVAVLNLREFDSGSQGRRGSQKYTIKVAPRSSWVVKRLTAPGARDQTNITFNGFAYEAASQGTPVRVAGRTTDERVKADGSGNILVTVADSEAVVMEARLDCVFERFRRESKDDLRTEIDRLRRANERSGALLDAMSSTDDAVSYDMVAKGLQDRTTTREDIFQELAEIREATDGPTPPWRFQINTMSPTGKLVSIHSLGASSGTTGVTAAKAEKSEPRSPAQRVDSWTCMGWTTALVLEYLESLLVWDYLPFCLLCRDLFLRDFGRGTGPYCSPGLVHALLALATRIADGQHYHHQQCEDGRPAAGWTDSETFFNAALSLVERKRQPSSLPDVQALGIMSLYCVGSGKVAEAMDFAGAFAIAATRLHLQARATPHQEGQYGEVCAATYCGAVSLYRILLLTGAQPSDQDAMTLQYDGITLDKWLYTHDSDDAKQDSGGGLQRRPHRTGTASRHKALGEMSPPLNPSHDASVEHISPLGSVQTIPAKIFQLTEWLYKLIAAPDTSANDVVSVYFRYLGWYESFFRLLKSDGSSNSPFILFIQWALSIYYQFCLLTLFRSFSSVDLGEFHVCPREICLQAAQTILVLTQSYAGLYGLGRVSPLMPYFVYAAGLLSQAVEEAGHATCMLEAVPLARFDCHGFRSEIMPVAVDFPEAVVKSHADCVRIGAVDSHHQVYHPERTLKQPQRPQHCQDQQSSSHAVMSAATHARLLLAEMGQAQPVAVELEGRLYRATGID
ncbi:glycoside hydrolase family 79 [Purpureocillium lavendulum]|uniref:Glycoside hydrolase family 79 n=1 Tax=Purpureocillium lavendulum TaxID=1247861 RepID=A0AB34FKY7_9HYPO|nr:glycoside hydrolase family 79 [Purpureocillium lavendulum]